MTLKISAPRQRFWWSSCKRQDRRISQKTWSTSTSLIGWSTPWLDRGNVPQLGGTVVRRRYHPEASIPTRISNKLARCLDKLCSLEARSAI